ncbi:MAG: DUF3237 domain-containing protein [Thermoleophilia bacterium]|nr:DUF3237 domain-containing protein [Thermoleophilia bacterium]
MNTPEALLDDVGPLSLREMGMLVADLGGRHILDGAPFGTRVIVDVTGMRITGDRLNATMVGTAAADWGARAADGTFQLDVRATLRTDDDALVFIQYNGRVDFSDPQRPGPVYCTPRFETGDPRYAWLNKIQVVMKGRSNGATLIAYRMYELV